MSVRYSPQLSSTKIKDQYGLEVLNRVQVLVASMSKETKKHLSEKLHKIESQPCPNFEEESIAESIAGKTYSIEQKKELEIINLMNSFSVREKLLENTITTNKVVELLACRSRQTPLDRVKNQTLIAVKDNGQWKYPLWQFDSEGADGVIEGLPETIQALQVSNLAKVSWLTRPHPVFNNLTPLDMLKKGEIEQVVNEAMGVGLAQ